MMSPVCESYAFIGFDKTQPLQGGSIKTKTTRYRISDMPLCNDNFTGVKALKGTARFNLSRKTDGDDR